MNVEIDLSNRCSLGCSWCHFAYTHTRGPLAGKAAKPQGATAGGDLMPLDLALTLITDLERAGVRSVTWTGGGEPTLHPSFDVIIARAALGPLEQGIYTHGGHINEERADLLSKALRWVYVSLDAADAADYKRDKGVDRFQAACDGVRRLAAATGAATVGVGFLLTERNWWRAWEMRDLAHSLGAAYAQFRPTILYDQDAPDTPAEATAWMAEALAALAPLADAPGVEIDLDRFRMYESWAGHGYETCYWSALQTVVTPNGRVWTCVNKREHAAELIGDLSEESFAEVWARHAPSAVNSRCRVMCRGHLANQSLNQIMQEREHSAFI